MILTNSKYNILGFIGGAHSCGVAYIRKGELVCVLEEERLTRVKSHIDFENDFNRFPTMSIETLINRYGLDLNEIDYFTTFLRYDEAYPIFEDFGFNLPENKFIKVDHHLSHAALSYYLSGFQEDSLVFCADASGGNGYNSKTYIGSQGKLKFIDGNPNSRMSLGHFYGALTEIVGFKRLKDEGKVVGLSGHGRFWQDLYDRWNNVLRIEDIRTNKDNHHLESGGVYRDLNVAIFDLFGSKYWKSQHCLQDIAYTGQFIFENKVLEWLNNLHNHFPNVRKLVLSGGIFANVKLNKRINELDWVEELFVLPPMGDEGLAFGSAIATLKQLEPSLMPFRTSMYLGNEYSKDEFYNAVPEILDSWTHYPLDLDTISELLLDKKILGLYQGRSEHGARALGNRSIICDCRNEETYQILNNKLQRNDFMPFAPAVLDEDAHKIFDVQKSRFSAEFMTILFDTKEEYREWIPTVVHPVDKTARIQIVKEDSNKLFYDILKNFQGHSGIGCLVNTSFNIHNEPIVERPEEALTHLKNGIIDYLITPYGIWKYGNY